MIADNRESLIREALKNEMTEEWKSGAREKRYVPERRPPEKPRE